MHPLIDPLHSAFGGYHDVVDDDDDDALERLRRTGRLRMFALHMALNHTVARKLGEQRNQLKGSSPDEKALVAAASMVFGVHFECRLEVSEFLLIVVVSHSPTLTHHQPLPMKQPSTTATYVT